MSTLVLMKILESSPSRYDRGIKLLIGKKIYLAFDRITSKVQKDDNILDVGCGTGILSIMMAQNGVKVKGIDINPDMLEIARTRVSNQNLSELVTLEEKGVAELDSEVERTYHLITATLCFSELENYEIEYALTHIHRILKPGGLFVLVDEIKPKNILKRILLTFIRIPLVIITYILTQNTTKALKDIESKIVAEGFTIVEKYTNRLGSFIELFCEKGE
ncbi:MAG: Malonyl-[acyl-carrier protein] O-methyltransferase [Candidatus Heimdallarchaeota archaeon LC_2]|nr:MAG: Malonyl-[acyl-carrier protein] O-methyltransferase [Candidatus Heimdallarchaeota archaeon LC_2]